MQYILIVALIECDAGTEPYNDHAPTLIYHHQYNAIALSSSLCHPPASLLVFLLISCF